jgi:hypothetical protein
VCVVRHPTALYAFFQVRKPNVRNGGSLAPVGFDGGNSRSWWAATGFRSVKTEEKKLLLLHLPCFMVNQVPALIFSSDPAACCLMDDHGLASAPACRFPTVSFFHNRRRSNETLLPFKTGVNVAVRLHS